MSRFVSNRTLRLFGRLKSIAIAVIVGSLPVALTIWLGLLQARTRIVVERSYPLMGTLVEVKVAAPRKQRAQAEAAIELAIEHMRDLIRILDPDKPSSDVALINQYAGDRPVEIDRRTLRLLLRAREVSDLTGGALDVTAVVMDFAAIKDEIGPGRSLDQAIEARRRLVDYRDIELDPKARTAFARRAGMRVGLGAIAKGAIVDAGAASLRRSGFPDALINAGGDLIALGAGPDGPWTAGVQDPRGARGRPLGVLSVRARAVATSGGYERFVEIDGRRYHHIVDPRAGRPADKSLSVTVLAPDAERADVWATALFVLGPREGLALCERLDDLEALFVAPDGAVTVSSGFPPIAPFPTP
jgi:thiamine biosynthesis lipoprotein